MGAPAGDQHITRQPSESAGRRSRGAPPNNLPDELTSFIGRTAELARLRELLGEARLVTLVGAGGCGKTRLALQSAVGALERFSDGAWWVELAALEDPDLLSMTIGSVLGLRDRPGRRPLDVLTDHLRDRHSLLVLDNCEHLLQACATLVHTLLRSCPGLVVLATSREALRVPGELPYRVPSLSLPAGFDSVGETTESDAVRLFVDRASVGRPDFRLTDDNVSAVTATCRGLDGIPLAIELAAARVGMLSPERIASELDDRFHLLTGGSRTAPPRHQTLRASIEWSHELCSQQEQLLLRRLSVCAGGWTLEAAEVIGAGDAIDQRAVLGLLTGLIDKSLVETEDHGGEIRYIMLETIRQYAAERLHDADEAGAAHARHLAWCMDLAERAEPELVGPHAGEWLRRLGSQDPNLRAAFERALASDANTAARLAAALIFSWLMRGRLEEGVTTLGRVLDVLPAPSPMRGKVLWGLAYLTIYRGRFETAMDYAERALEDAEAVGDGCVMARALTTQGLILGVMNPLHGRAPLERSLALAREAGDAWCTADAARLLGGSYRAQSEHVAGRAIQDEGYALARELGYRPFEAWHLGNRATAELEHGRLETARELGERATAVSAEIGEPVTLGYATAVLAECDVLQGLPADARARADSYVETMRTTGARSAEPWIAGALALADLVEGSPEVALSRVEATLPLIEAGRAYDQVARAHRGRAVAQIMLGRLDDAAVEAERLLAHAESGGNEHLQAIARHLLGRVAFARDKVVEAEGHLHEALTIAARRDFRLQTLDVLESLAQVAAVTDSPAEAARLLAAVRAAREQLATVRVPPEPEVWTGVEEHVRSELGDHAFAAASEEGLALSVNEVVEYARRARGERKRPSYGWESLTPTEHEVVRHAAAGLTNPEIGKRLFISRATVKAHLSHIFLKLGVSSRLELAAEVARRAKGTESAGE